ncbi:MAG: DUF3368 domain-containing protein [Anaerolineales bacterium]|nr:DUF3368 domain-containing protein [Chloroflexota bacterium]MBL6983164.1 DUF3368 domain-containing protein [Anaerolineales bacterium]
MNIINPVLLDNTVLTNFGLAQRPDLPHTLWPNRGCTTLMVMEEYYAGVQGGGLPEGAWDNLPVLTLSPDEKQWMSNLPVHLGAGEQTCLAVSYLRQGLFASDDLRARSMAQNLGVPVVGSVGILILSVRRNMVDQSSAQELLEQMIASGYHSPVDDLNNFINK